MKTLRAPLAALSAVLWASVALAEGPAVRIQAHDGTIHTYALEKELGHGAWSSAHLAYDTQTNERVVIKLLRPERLKNGVQDTFEKEDGILEAVGGKGALPRSFGLGQTLEEHPARAFALERIDGERLSDHMVRAPGKSVRIGLKLLDDVQRLHEKGWVHLDIHNPANAMIDHAQHSKSVRLIDVGNAHKIDPQHQPVQDVKDIAKLVAQMITGSNKMEPATFAALNRLVVRTPRGNSGLGNVINAAWAGRFRTAPEFANALQPFSKI